MKNNENETLKNTIDDVIKLVRNKYSHTLNILLSENILTLEYMHTFGEDRDCFQTMTLKELEGKLSIEFLTQHISKIIDIQELEDIFEMLRRQSNYKEHTSAEVKAIKQKYIKGTKIKLIKMYDLFAPPNGTIGTVDCVDDIGQIQMTWSNGSTLALNVDIDDFEILK